MNEGLIIHRTSDAILDALRRNIGVVVSIEYADPKRKILTTGVFTGLKREKKLGTIPFEEGYVDRRSTLLEFRPLLGSGAVWMELQRITEVAESPADKRETYFWTEHYGGKPVLVNSEESRQRAIAQLRSAEPTGMVQ